MPKLHADYTVPLNILLGQDGTKEILIAVAYYRGQGGRFAGPARDFLRDGCERFAAGLSPKERARFDEILANVKFISSGGTGS